MLIKKFEDLFVWQKSQDLTVNIYNIFVQNRDYGFKDQIQRASLSISNNIAEGFERQSKKEFKRFLYIARGSCGEVRSMLYLALRLKYSSKENFEKLSNEVKYISKLLTIVINK